MQLLLVIKEKGMTSFDVTKKVQKLLHVDKVGHTGTLDPMATGLMILTINKATKLLPYIVSHNKEYICEMQFGYNTDTLDAEGVVIDKKEPSNHTIDEINAVFNSFLGDIQQIPPMFSAKKINGQKLCDLARKGIEIERKPCDITIHEIELISYENNIIKYRCKCSAGTYIRVLCQDIASKLNENATMISLCRTKIEDFCIDNAYTFKQIECNEHNFIDAYDLLKDYEYIEYQNINDIYNGKAIKLNCDNPIVMITNKRDILAAYKKEEDGLYHCLRGLW